MRLPVSLLATIIALLTASGLAWAAPAKETGLPLPRFASFRSSEVNLRTGPGVRYPVEWVYRRQDLPVEVIAEFDTWRKIRDWQGGQGWVHQSMLSAKRTVIVTGKVRTLRVKPDAGSGAVAQLEANVIAKLTECPETSHWCRVQVEKFDGWLRRAEFWGAYPDEAVK